MMFKFGFMGAGGALPRRALFLGAHCDDIAIGCGGTVLKLANELPELEVHWVVLSSSEVRESEERKAASKFLESFNNVYVQVERFRNGYFPGVAADIKDYFETLKPIEPDVIFTHYRQDLHQDHRTVAELTWNTFRSHCIFEYEIPKYDGDFGSPNVFVPISRSILRRKCAILMDVFASQRDKQWFTADLFGAIGRLRGVECVAEEGLAEAFYCKKLSF
jgi:LmbE family N-acetylglucosaminyl deacetylase